MQPGPTATTIREVKQAIRGRVRRLGWTMVCKSNLEERSVPERPVNQRVELTEGSTLRDGLTCRTVEPHGDRSGRESHCMAVGHT
jgi:hypothetical protein